MRRGLQEGERGDCGRADSAVVHGARESPPPGERAVREAPAVPRLVQVAKRVGAEPEAGGAGGDGGGRDGGRTCVGGFTLRGVRRESLQVWVLRRAAGVRGAGRRCAERLVVGI